VQKLPQFDPQHAIPLALSCAFAFCICFAITYFCITPRITNALSNRQSRIASIDLSIARSNEYIALKIAELAKIRASIAYNYLHQEWEAEYNKIQLHTDNTTAIRQAYWTTQLRLHNLQQTPELITAHQAIEHQFFGYACTRNRVPPL
jgi:hypothetical protein